LPTGSIIIGKLRSPSPSLILAATGALLALGGCIFLVVLAFAATGDAADADRAAGSASTGRSAEEGLLGMPSALPEPDEAKASGPALVLGPDGEPVPYWKAKQDEARRAGLNQDTETPQADATDTDERPGDLDEDLPEERARPASAATAPAAASTLPAPATTQTTQAPPVPTTRAVGAGGSTLLEGVWGGTARELADYLLAANPAPKFSVATLQLAEYYVRYAAEVSLRADVLWAQMIHETGYGKYGGSVSPGQNNYAGIGATGGPVPGHTFPTAEEGVKGHVAHMVAYVYPTDMASWTNSLVDPRYHMVEPRGIARVISDLDGRWAVPGVGYGERIERHVRSLNP
jgi:hypothetical protein